MSIYLDDSIYFNDEPTGPKWHNERPCWRLNAANKFTAKKKNIFGEITINNTRGRARNFRLSTIYNFLFRSRIQRFRYRFARRTLLHACSSFVVINCSNSFEFLRAFGNFAAVFCLSVQTENQNDVSSQSIFSRMDVWTIYVHSDCVYNFPLFVYNVHVCSFEESIDVVKRALTTAYAIQDQ